MARIIVISEHDDREGIVVLDERADASQLEGGSEAARLIERLGWAIHRADAHRAGTASRM